MALPIDLLELVFGYYTSGEYIGSLDWSILSKCSSWSSSACTTRSHFFLIGSLFSEPSRASPSSASASAVSFLQAFATSLPRAADSKCPYREPKVGIATTSLSYEPLHQFFPASPIQSSSQTGNNSDNAIQERLFTFQPPASFFSTLCFSRSCPHLKVLVLGFSILRPDDSNTY